MIKTKLLNLIVVIAAITLIGCSILPIAGTEGAPQSTPTTASTHTTADSTALPTTEIPTPGPVTLRIWLPPQYDPASGAQAGVILQERLDEFTSRYPDVSVEVRIKAEHGPGGMLDSLAATSAAAPLALPDLVALSYEDLQAAALKGLLHPYDGLTNTMTEADWYEYALDMAILQNSTFGLPFAGDAQVMVYRPEVIEEPPHNWATTLQTPEALVFSAADPLALFTLAQYQANGGDIRDEEGRPFLDEGTLTEVLTFYQQAEAVEVMPFWLTQFQSNEQVWEAFLEDRTDMVVTWASSYLNEKLIDSAVDFYPTPNGRPYSLSTGWVWALATANPEHHELSVRLAEFLTDSNFLAEWTEALGYLPPRPSSLRAWSETASDPVLERVSSSAVLLPTMDLLSSLGPPLERATVDVLKQQSDPATAAQSAIDSLVEP